MRKICAILTSRAHYGRMKYILQQLRDDPEIELQVILGGAALSDTYGSIVQEFEGDNIPINHKILMIIEGGSPLAMAKTTAVGLMEFSTALDNLQPDIVLVRGDRFETLAAAIAASYMNLTLAHIEGGDVSGTIDDSVRHAVTKLAHIHLTTNDESAERVKRLGEHPEHVFNVGTPDIEFIMRNKTRVDKVPTHIFGKGYPIGGVGTPIDLTKPYLVVLQHPVTTEYGDGRQQMLELLEAIDKLKMPTVFFWPNQDAGTDELSKAVRQYINIQQPEHIYFLKNIPPNDFLALVNHAACLVGNSSAGIKEASFLGTPVVNIGTRQQGRMRGKNVVDVDYKAEDIMSAIRKQIQHGKYKSETIYGGGNTAELVAAILKKVPLLRQKRIAH